MAHGTEKRTQLRGLYVYKRLTMDAACGAMTLPVATGRRWKREAKGNGDDWDTARSAVALGDDNFRDMSRRLQEDYITQHEHIMGELKADKQISAMDRIKAYGSIPPSHSRETATASGLAAFLKGCVPIGNQIVHHLFSPPFTLTKISHRQAIYCAIGFPDQWRTQGLTPRILGNKRWAEGAEASGR